MQLPKCPLQYGSTRNLFDRMLRIITQHVEIQDTSARLLAYFAFSTWFPDRLSLVPGLAGLGPAENQGVQLLRLLRCLCRRSILLAEASQASLLSLPLQLSPTLLMNRPILTRQLRNFLSTSNRRGLATVKRGRVLEVCCPKAVYFGMGEIPQDITSIMIHIPLISTTARKSVLEDGALNKITCSATGRQPCVLGSASTRPARTKTQSCKVWAASRRCASTGPLTSVRSQESGRLRSPAPPWLAT